MTSREPCTASATRLRNVAAAFIPGAASGPFFVAMGLMLMSGAACADDIGTGRVKARPCAACHGPLGVSTMPDTPNLAAQPASYLTVQLKAYRDGSRKHDIMGMMAKPLSDDDIAQLAAWFASIRIEANAAP